jgi:hypothetical protein
LDRVQVERVAEDEDDLADADSPVRVETLGHLRHRPAGGQAAVLAVGRIADRVVAANGQPVIRPMMTITLSSDHRVVDGAQAAVFLNDLAAALEPPLKKLGL